MYIIIFRHFIFILFFTNYDVTTIICQNIPYIHIDYKYYKQYAYGVNKTGFQSSLKWFHIADTSDCPHIVTSTTRPQRVKYIFTRTICSKDGVEHR